ncbi:hypothetical protein Dda_3018 [Drechslerella dactyloides]|uniref:Uncharacterized protein n=1 Tax=Drechslerella dactyloides TaxID=74499 RepID=A0AAD6J0J7_DREDA|nr:hypothetical protein Dda_3018 [Drechslerella dactyloides]
MGRQHMQWTPQADQNLLLAVLATSPPIDNAKVAAYAGLTKNNVKWRLHTLDKEAAKRRAATEGGESPFSTPSKKRPSTYAEATPPNFKKKRVAKAGKKKSIKDEDTSDGESLTPQVFSDSDDNCVPSLRDDYGTEGEETGPSSIEPETPPTKIMPRRSVKLEKGDYAKIVNKYDEDSEDERFTDMPAYMDGSWIAVGTTHMGPPLALHLTTASYNDEHDKGSLHADMSSQQLPDSKTSQIPTSAAQEIGSTQRYITRVRVSEFDLVSTPRGRAVHSIMSDLGYFNLPWPILVHSVGLTLLGLTMTFSPKPGPSPEVRGANSILGITTTTIGLAYLGTSHMPIEQNQFLHASVPIRLAVAILLFTAAAANRRTMDEKGWKVHIGFGLWDGVGALWLGWYLGRWDGRIPA